MKERNKKKKGRKGKDKKKKKKERLVVPPKTFPKWLVHAFIIESCVGILMLHFSVGSLKMFLIDVNLSSVCNVLF